GLYLMLSVQDNMIVANIDAYMNGMFLDFKKINAACEEGIEKLSVKTPSKEQLIGNLSGGNQQKVLIARWLLTEPDILILDEPTRGIDVGAKAEIHKLMSKLAGEGKAVIMISSELPEVLGMSDRIMVMHEGRKTGELMRGDATQENIMYLATGKN
ncbi:MAG: ATP-binding cassette domain-containing protein, partial [Marinisporobacter sp.]|nr:ATP-binding cassette domain-containing protein [Marinisporobacter sp.]